MPYYNDLKESLQFFKPFTIFTLHLQTSIYFMVFYMMDRHKLEA